MWQLIKRAVQPPRFADKAKTYQASLIYVIVPSLMVALTLNIFFVFTWSAHPLADSLAGISLFIAFSGCLYWTKRGFVRAASLILVLGMWAIVTSFLISYGPHAAGANAFNVVVMVATLLLGARGAVLAISLNALSLAVFVYPGAMGFRADPGNAELYTLVYINMVIYFAIGIAAYTVTRAMGGFIVRTHSQAEALQASIEEHKQVEQSLRESSVRYRVLFENAHDAIWVYSPEGRVVTANSQACELTGYTLEEMIGQTGDFFIAPEAMNDAAHKFRQTVKGSKLSPYERTLVCKNGEHRNVEVKVTRITDVDGKTILIQSAIIDVTERKLAEAQIQASLQEKELLLKEIHHRVKNNLQVISSLLDLQSSYITDESVREMFQESRSRVRSMALAHEQLYHSTTLAWIDFEDYANSLMEYLSRVYRHMTQRVIIEKEIAAVSFNIETAVPLGLIINELISNAFKHAFPDGRDGRIRLYLCNNDDGQYQLVVQDDGVGFPETVDFRRSPSLGLTIVTTLADQLQGRLVLYRESGTRFELDFVVSTQTAQPT